MPGVTLEVASRPPEGPADEGADGEHGQQADPQHSKGQSSAIPHDFIVSPTYRLAPTTVASGLSLEIK